MANLSKCSILFDESELMYFVPDPLRNKKVYLAHKKRFELYSGGVEKRLNWLISDYRIPLAIIKPNDIIVDIGANAGELSLHPKFANVNYIGIEPDPNAFKALTLNKPNGHLRNIALSNQEGMQEFYLCTSEADSSLFEPASYTESIQVKTTTLDKCLEGIKFPIEKIKLLKLEAEGMEPEILDGASKTLTKVLYIALDAGPERGSQSTAPACLNILFENGFRLRDTYLTRGTFFLKNTLLDATL